MNDPTTSTPGDRHLAVDLHKHYLVVGGVNGRQEVVLTPRRLDLDDWLGWAKAHLHPSDTLVVEATTNTWDFYDQTRPLVGRLLVANAGKIALIAKTRVKTDNLDVFKLARWSVANLIPEVWVQPICGAQRSKFGCTRWLGGRLHGNEFTSTSYTVVLCSGFE